MLKLYRIDIKEYDYDCYTDFIIVANSIPEALEYLYKKVCSKCDEDGHQYYTDIPFYLRSSNMEINHIGNFIPLTTCYDNILSYGYQNA